MAIEVTLYNFTKKTNSTARPSGDGFTVNMVLKDHCSIFEPRLEYHLSSGNPSGYTYASIPEFSRYYFITDWSWENGVWVGSFKEDCLATFKTEIGNADLYVLRSAADSDKSITDGYYPAKTTIVTKTSSKDFKTELGWPDEISSETGHFIVGVVNNLANVNGSVCYYHLTGQEMAAFRAYMLSSIASWDDITDFSGDVAKAFIDPFQYVVSCMWFPTSPAIKPEKTKIAFGFWESDLSADYVESYTKEYPFTITRPTRDAPLSVYPYLHKTPWAHYYLYCQPWGLIELPGDSIAATGIECMMVFDFITGSTILTVKSKQSGDVLFSGEAMVGVSMQLSNISFDYKSLTSVSGLKNMAMNSAIAAVAGGAQSFTANNILSSAIAGGSSVESSGSNSGMAAVSLGGDATLFAQFYEPVDFDNADNGSPLCKKTLISGLPGFNKVENGSINISGTQQERETLRSYLEGGFYYE